MRKLSSLPICFTAFLMLIAATACSDPDKTAGNPGVTPPTVISITPPDGSIATCANTIVTATFSKAMNPATLSTTTFTVTGPGGASVLGLVTYDSPSHTALFTPAATLALSTTYTATITTGAKDVFGNALANNFVWTFTTGVAPCVPPAPPVSVTPPNGSAGACPDSVIVANFPQAMDPTTINTGTFLVTPGIAGTVTHDVTDTIFTFTPSAPLGLNTTYTVTITTGARDLFGVSLVNDFVWTFTTSTTSCTAPPPPPTVISVTPPAGAAGLCPNSIVTATFSEAMNPATIDDTTFTLTGPGGALVAGQVTYNAGSDTAIFTPSNVLALSSLYTATITTGAHNLLGTALASNVVWTFTTGTNPCQPPRPPTFVTPPDAAIGVCPDTVIAVTFPQAMDPTTINATTFTVTPGVTGAITHDVANKIFTLTPSVPLALSTPYTATVTTGAKDPFGNALASNFIWTFTTAASACSPPPPPVVISVTPLDGALGVCSDAVITATFNEAMNPLTLNNTTFTVAPGVTGIVTMDGTGRIAAFTPTAALALATTYTATITTGAQDPGGLPLAADFVWTFTTATLACQPPVPLGSAANFEALAGSTVTNTGPTIITGGNLGLSPGSAVTGFPPGTLTPPAVMHVTDPTAAQAELDLTAAYLYAAGLPGGAVLPGDVSGLTFAPGLYTNATTVMLSAGNFTLDAQGNANAVFIFQVGSTLTTIGSTQVVLAGGAQAKNVFWVVGSSATVGTNAIFEGTILSLQSITLQTGATLNGRALARNGAVTLDSNTVTVP